MTSPHLHLLINHLPIIGAFLALPLLALPLKSTGRLHFLAPGHLARVVETPVGRVFALYTVIGDAFSWLCLLSVAGMVLHGVRDWRRSSSDSSVTPPETSA